jgi:phosphoglycolate phosphatase
MIGDRYSDYEAAIRENTPFLFCKYGHSDLGEIPEFSKEISKPSELLEIF